MEIIIQILPIITTIIIGSQYKIIVEKEKIIIENNYKLIYENKININNKLDTLYEKYLALNNYIYKEYKTEIGLSDIELLYIEIQKIVNKIKPSINECLNFSLEKCFRFQSGKEYVEHYLFNQDEFNTIRNELENNILNERKF